LPDGEQTDPVKTLILIFTAVWILVLAGTILIFEFIVPFNPFDSFFLNSTLKGVLSLILAGAWVYLFASLRDIVMRRELQLSKGKKNREQVAG
jgi:membrane protein implicated in regulation of membrane protease activity